MATKKVQKKTEKAAKAEAEGAVKRVPPRIVKRATAAVMQGICVTGQTPMTPARAPKTAKATASGFHCLPRPFSM